eukprot:Nk52_evm2s379 gene=Nk52_evmTU2s379
MVHGVWVRGGVVLRRGCGGYTCKGGERKQRRLQLLVEGFVFGAVRGNGVGDFSTSATQRDCEKGGDVLEKGRKNVQEGREGNSGSGRWDAFFAKDKWSWSVQEKLLTPPDSSLGEKVDSKAIQDLLGLSRLEEEEEEEVRATEKRPNRHPHAQLERDLKATIGFVSKLQERIHESSRSGGGEVRAVTSLVEHEQLRVREEGKEGGVHHWEGQGEDLVSLSKEAYGRFYVVPEVK